MGEILQLILNETSIYKRAELYKLLVRNNFDITEKVPVLYKAVYKDDVLNYLRSHSVENECFHGEFGIIYLLMEELDIIKDIIDKIKDYIYFDFSYPLVLNDLESNFNSCVAELVSSKKLFGNGVVIAFIDTGIDYTLKAFRKEDGTTRIRYMYDPNINVVYNSDQINEALRNENPFGIIKETDFKGHGTDVASVACAGGDIRSNLYGVAPQSEIISINATTNIDSTETLFHTIIKGLEFLAEKQDQEGFPLVVNLSFSTNYGGHTGTSILEEYVRTFATRSNTTVVVSAGNEGGASHHKSGILTNDGEDIEIEISGDHKSIPVSFYKGVLSDVIIRITSPTTGTSQPIKLFEGNQIINLGGNSISIIYSGPTMYNIQGETQIIIGSNRKEYIEQGVWIINIMLTNEYESEYNMWLPITESIGRNTKFLRPNNDNTLGSPATVHNVISVGSYNYRTETVSIFSGRGAVDNLNNLKPDLLAPGESVRVIGVGNRVHTVSGTSFSAPVVSGICALLMEWGIVLKNKPNLYGEVIKYFLVRGATRLNSIKYPNNVYGYGFACASRAFVDIEDSINGIISDISSLNRVDDPMDNNQEVLDNENNGTESGVQIFDPEDLIQNELIDLNTGIDLSKYDNMDINICPLSVFQESGRASFIATINKNNEPIKEPFCVYPLEDQGNDTYLAILSMPVKSLNVLLDKYTSNSYVVIERLYYYTLCAEIISPISDAGIYQTQNNEYLDLRGRDVIVGIIDTGIDYLNQEFMNEFDETRILEIWDQTIVSDTHQPDVLFGHIYTKNDIDSAIKLKRNGGDPYTIVPSKDTNGHGTAMAGITSAAGYGMVKGAAPESNIAVVKLKEISMELKGAMNFPLDDTPVYDDVSLYLAIRYLRSLSVKYNKPMVVVVPLQSNGGIHSGESIVSRQITEYSRSIGFIVVTPSGNQANKQIHTEGILKKRNDEEIIELFTGKGQNKLNINIYVQNFGRLSLSVVSPSGERTSSFNVQSALPDKYTYKFLFEGTEMNVISTLKPTNFEITLGVEIVFSGLKSGIWQIILISQDDNEFKYNAYLPLKELLIDDTRFLNSTSNNTITAPGTSRLSVSMAYYNQNFSSIVNESGQGYTLDGRIAPILAAGGIDILTLGKSGRTILMSGSSVAAAVTAGGVALILEWAIVRKNKPQINAAIIIWLLVSAATITTGYQYPNKYWGYGILNIRNVFEILR